MNRREFIGAAAALAAGTCARAKGKKHLIIYFSRADENYGVGYVSKGNTEVLESIVAEALGDVEVFRIVPEKAYPKVYDDCTAYAKAEQRRRGRPAYQGDFTHLDDYDTVFLGFPCWWGDLPMAFYTFLEKHPLGKKTVIPFCTHEGSGFGRTLSGLKRQCPDIKLLEGLSMYGSEAQAGGEAVRSAVKAWLRRLGY